MELEEDGTLGRSTGIYYKATTRGGNGVGRQRRGNRAMGLGLRIEEKKQEVGTVERSMGK